MERQTKSLQYVIIGALVIFLSYNGIHYILYGSFTNDCIYTEKELPLPQVLSEGVIEVTQTAYIILGDDAEYACLPVFKILDGEIVGPADFKNSTLVRKNYYEDLGFTVKEVTIGKKFKVTKEIEITKHGVGTIDSGPGPDVFVILSDETGGNYKIATASLGLNKDDLFLKFISPSKTLLLEGFNFWDDTSLSRNLIISNNAH